MTEAVVSDRPTFAQAFAEAPAADSLPATPTVDASPGETPSADAIAPPPETTTDGLTPGSGPIPLERHKAILDGAYKERDTFKSQVDTLKQQLESPDSQRLRQWQQAYTQNPTEWFAQTARELVAQHPDLAAQMRSDAARILAGGRSTPDVDLAPDIPVYDEAGKEVTRTYSAGKMQAIVQKAIAEALTKEVGPLKQTVQSVEQERAQLARKQQAETYAQTEYARAQAWPGFTDHEAAIGEAFSQHPEWSLQDAYISVAVPKLQAASSAKTLDDLKTKAAAGTMNPSAAVVPSPRKVTSLLDASLEW